MHVIVPTDGSKQSLTAARKLKSFADPTKIDEITILAVVRPLAAVSFVDDLSPRPKGRRNPAAAPDLSFREAAISAVDVVAAEFAGWGPKVHKKVRSGSPAGEIIKLASTSAADLIVIGAGGRGLSETILVGSTAQHVQQYAPCPVLVVRPTKRSRAKK
ncbi:universal stress protein [Janibacter sp. G1551]|uniref:universal stress protein n=1 Tax=Janibacter sp. G1551 TaxID=3420440 RepID=UPI003D08218E